MPPNDDTATTMEPSRDTGSEPSTSGTTPIRLGRTSTGAPTQFPRLLHTMLSSAERDGYSDIVSWQPHGMAFVIRNRKKFLEKVLPVYFKQTRFASFQRQLNMYGFLRVEKRGPDHKSYYHEQFKRDESDHVDSMIRMQNKEEATYANWSPTPTPDFFGSRIHHATQTVGIVPNQDTQQDITPSHSPATAAHARSSARFPHDTTYTAPNVFPSPRQYALVDKAVAAFHGSGQHLSHVTAAMTEELGPGIPHPPIASMAATFGTGTRFHTAAATMAKSQHSESLPPDMEDCAKLPAFASEDSEVSQKDESSMVQFLEGVDLGTSDDMVTIPTESSVRIKFSGINDRGL
jgi:hypothetical protein